MKRYTAKDIIVIALSAILSTATTFFCYRQGYVCEWVDIGLAGFILFGVWTVQIGNLFKDL